MHVATGVDVGEQILPDVIRVLVDREVVAAVPAPVGEDRPIPERDVEEESVAEPESMPVAIDPDDADAVLGPELLETPVLERSFESVAKIVGGIVAVPMVPLDMRSAIDAIGFAVLHFGLAPSSLRSGAGGSWPWLARGKSR